MPFKVIFKLTRALHLILLPLLVSFQTRAVDPPMDVQCIGIEPGKYIIRFLGEGAPILYELGRRHPNDENFTTLGTVGPITLNSKDQYRGEFLDDPENFLYEYRVRAVNPEIEGDVSAWSPIMRTPTFEESENFRIFFNEIGCPPNDDGSENCIQSSVEDGDGNNLLALQILSYLEGSLLRFAQLGFNTNISAPFSADKYPANLKQCDGVGCARPWGIGLSPDDFLTYNSQTNTGTAATLSITLHELFHIIQGINGIGDVNDPLKGWILEGHARALQGLMCVPTDVDNCENLDDENSDSFRSQIVNYFANANIPINDSGCEGSASPSGACGYNASLFWFFMCEQYGLTNSEPERGIDFLVQFYQHVDAGDGIDIINETLAALGHQDDFRDAFKNFVTLNISKDLTNADPSHRYIDETVNSVPAVLSQNLALNGNNQLGPLKSDVRHWAVKYYQVTLDNSDPTNLVPSVDININVENGNPAYFGIIASNNEQVVGNISRHVGYSISSTIMNTLAQPIDKVMVVVAGLEQDVNFNISVNATNPVLKILSPTQSSPAYVGLANDPEKFILSLEVLNPDGTGLEGLDINSLNMLVGFEPIIKIIQSVYLGGGQYWLVVRAPHQPSLLEPAPPPPIFNLIVLDETIGDAQIAAVTYGDDPLPNSANALVIDRSASMFELASKNLGARAAAKAYVDSFKVGDYFSIASFTGAGEAGTCSSEGNFGMAPWFFLNRDISFVEINTITSFPEAGSSSIGLGLSEGLGQFVSILPNLSDETLDMFLLSDGLNNCGDTIDDFMEVYNQRVEDGLKVPVIHTLAIGPDANRPDLEELAKDTGGEYSFVSDFELPPLNNKGLGSSDGELDYLWNIIDSHRFTAEIIRGEQRIIKKRDGGTPGEREHIFVIDQGTRELILSISGTPQIPNIDIEDPSGGTNYQPDLTSPITTTFKIIEPPPGFWTVTISSPLCDTCLVPDYFIEAAVQSSLEMYATVALPLEERIIGTPVPIKAALSDTGPILGAFVLANLEGPQGEQFNLGMHDNGHNEDEIAGDGVYTGVLYDTSVSGTYQGTIVALGTSEVLGGFQRQRPINFHMRAGRNSDGDCIDRNNPHGLSDTYEEDNGLNPQLDDGNLDPDHDGLSNCDEFDHGTNPQDCDSDDDGESDNSEITHGTNPLDPTDGTVRPVRAAAIPGIDEVTLKFSAPSSVFALEIQRKSGVGDFQIIEPSYSALDKNEYIDDSVRNGNLYVYRIVSLGVDGQRSCPTYPMPATPKQDPYAPHGQININDGEPTTETEVVHLSIWASDSFDPEHNPEEWEDEEAEVSGVVDMIVSNRADFKDAQWQPYQTQLSPWILQDSSGLSDVFVKFRDAQGNISETVSDSIEIVSDSKVPHLKVSTISLGPSCSGTEEITLLLDTHQPAIGFSLTLEIQPRPRRTPLEVINVRVPEEVENAVESLQIQPVELPQDFLSLSIDLQLDQAQGVAFGPGTEVPILILEVQSKDARQAEESIELCIPQDPEEETVQAEIRILEGREIQNVTPSVECGVVAFVDDNSPPVLTPPEDIEIICAGPRGSIVEFEVLAEDTCDSEIQITCSPPSGSQFPIGVTLVTCLAEDSSGNASRSQFQVIVGTRGCFKRGDCDRNNQLNLGDPMTLLISMFRGGIELECEDSCDSNDNGILEIADALILLQYMFIGGENLPLPGAHECGNDTTRDDLNCNAALTQCE